MLALCPMMEARGGPVRWSGITARARIRRACPVVRDRCQGWQLGEARGVPPDRDRQVDRT